MLRKLDVFVAIRDNGDGSQAFNLFNKKATALMYLDRTEEQLENGSPYDDGILREAVIELWDDMQTGLSLAKPFSMDTDG